MTPPSSVFLLIGVYHGTMVRTITLETAKAMLDAAEETAAESDAQVGVAVANSEGNLLAFRRMDGTNRIAAQIARDKAYTAAAFRAPTHVLQDGAEPGGHAYGLDTTSHGRVVVFGGGFPVTKDGSVVGAIGASGGDIETDMSIARAGLEVAER